MDLGPSLKSACRHFVGSDTEIKLSVCATHIIQKKKTRRFCFKEVYIWLVVVQILHAILLITGLFRFFGILHDMLTWWILLVNGCTIAILLVTENSQMLISVVLLQSMGPDGTSVGSIHRVWQIPSTPSLVYICEQEVKGVYYPGLRNLKESNDVVFILINIIKSIFRIRYIQILK